MKALVLKEIGKLNICEVDKPDPSVGEVIVRVAATGICGSDIGIYRGTNELATYPRIIGHEFGGIVEAVYEVEDDCKYYNRNQKTHIMRILRL